MTYSQADFDAFDWCCENIDQVKDPLLRAFVVKIKLEINRGIAAKTGE